MMIEGAWSDLELKGYVVARSFLSEDSLALLRSDYTSGARPDQFFLGLKPIGLSALDGIAGEVSTLLATIRAQTTLQVDALLKGYYFATEYVNYTWHQDFDVLAQDLVNYVNLYIPIRKPERRKTNLTIAPYDQLARESPAAYRHLKNGSGRTLSLIDGTEARYRVVDARNYSESVLEFRLETCALTPELDEGDLLVLRSDVLHRTQDADTDRLAISLRVANATSTLSLAGLRAAGPLRRGQRLEADALQHCLDALERDAVTTEEFLRFQRSRPR